MPIYEYLCDKCEREFEAEQRITDEPIRSCPHCRSRKVRRLISQTSFVLKGGGWYSDLYSSGKSKTDGAAKETSGDSKPSSEAASDASGAKESKGSSPPTTDTKGPGPGGKGKRSEAKAA
jgi:putative FmdB family regulatory protein